MSRKQLTVKESFDSSSSHLPIIGICGFSGAGKTTVIEAILPNLLQCGLRVAVVKHDCQNVKMDRPGKDSYRFYQAGADVFLLGAEETRRIHGDKCTCLTEQLAGLACRYDLVLVEGHGKTPVAKLWMLSEGESQSPAYVYDVEATFSRNDREESVLQYLWRWLDLSLSKTPVWGCVLIGGQSRRMGSAKHLLQRPDGRSWLECAVSRLEPYVDGVVVSGSGRVPEHLSQLTRLPDVPGVCGPLSGILAASRWQPRVSWLLLACDMPDVTEASIKWLLKKRRPGVWGIVPTDRQRKKLQPLLAYYDFRCGKLFEQIHSSGSWRIGDIGRDERVVNPEIPECFSGCWRNVNTPAELDG